jgi:hypothetical protein
LYGHQGGDEGKNHEEDHHDGIGDPRRETLPSKIHITKEEYGPTKELVRTCEEDVELAKCEGSCVSSTQPSAMERSGFLKDCKCCRESGYSERTLTLHNCYNGDGHKLEGGLGTMQVTIQEPDGCQCYGCGSALPR